MDSVAVDIARRRAVRARPAELAILRESIALTQETASLLEILLSRLDSLEEAEDFRGQSGEGAADCVDLEVDSRDLPRGDERCADAVPVPAVSDRPDNVAEAPAPVAAEKPAPAPAKAPAPAPAKAPASSSSASQDAAIKKSLPSDAKAERSQGEAPPVEKQLIKEVRAANHHRLKMKSAQERLHALLESKK